MYTYIEIYIYISLSLPCCGVCNAVRGFCGSRGFLKYWNFQKLTNGYFANGYFAQALFKG